MHHLQSNLLKFFLSRQKVKGMQFTHFCGRVFPLRFLQSGVVRVESSLYFETDRAMVAARDVRVNPRIF